MRLDAGGSGFSVPACLVLLKVPVVTVGIVFRIPYTHTGALLCSRVLRSLCWESFFLYSQLHMQGLYCVVLCSRE